MSARSWLLEAGRWSPGESLPLTDRGPRYGMAVFETFGVREGRPLLEQKHLALLDDSASALLGARAPSSLPALASSDTGMLRVYITAGDGGPTEPRGAGRTFALFEPLAQTLRAGAATARLHPEAVAPFARGRKTANYWAQCEAESAAKAAGFDHALIADDGGRILSAALGNIFFVLGGELCTPSARLAVRPGAMRDWVMSRCTAREVELPASELLSASELFLTNSRAGVLPLQYGAIAPGPVASELRAACLAEGIIP